MFLFQSKIQVKLTGQHICLTGPWWLKDVY